ncbi:MAG: GtrA family protein, partial [Alistipes sp.]|nr:GtrA family protein [Alistipes sp.]
MNFSRRFTETIDWFHRGPLRAIPIQPFRYIACGGINFVVTIAIYAIAYNLVFAKQNFVLGPLVLSPHVAALGISLPVNFLIGFW